MDTDRAELFLQVIDPVVRLKDNQLRVQPFFALSVSHETCGLALVA